ncbi:uncharacterized protein LOC129571403 [Sitodiplosis mosellana]|uniref:uncharacterized protein LOC129571403 n=1 Tax=Sitodiplosis mosellana TaxID=263140 RepID=UPI0024447843|nr:uncharacterized protein LOC129571403 [Sitodiplosis mosellana]
MSYCRITGRARGLPKSNYFPLLPPISPADARRFCRITGRAYGLPTHCYIPVILTAFSNKSKCKITSSVGLTPHHYEPEDYEYGRRKHIVLGDYRYLLPKLDENNDQQKGLFEILNSKTVQCDEHYFIYAIKEQKCNLVFPAKLEAAVRDGDVRDVMFAKTNDSVLLCMNKGKSVSLDLQDYEIDSENCAAKRNLFEGEGPTYNVLLARETEEKYQHQVRTKRKKNGLRKIKTIDGSACTTADNNSPGNNNEQNGNLANDAQMDTKSEHANCNGCESETQHPVNEMNDTVQKYADQNGYSQKSLELNDTNLYESIPNQSEILKIMQNYSKGTVVYDHPSSISGLPTLNINIGTDEAPRNVLILGCIVNTSDGDVFVAGRTVVTENASTIFEPGIYLQSKNGPAFIPGQIIQCEEGERFVPGQIIDTEFGPRFVPGKISEVDGEVTFIPAQIVQTDQGPKFIAPDLCDDENGERKYSVQSFLFSPEEMTLLKPMHIWTKSDQNVDGNMFNHLSEAGIVVGSQIEVSNVDVNVLLQNAIKGQTIKKFAEHLGFTDAKQSSGALESLFETVKTFVKMMHQNPQRIFSVAQHDSVLRNENGNSMVNGNTLGHVVSENIDLPLIDIISRTVIDCLFSSSNSDTLTDPQLQSKNNTDPLLYEVISQALMKNFKPFLENADSINGITVCFNEIEKLLSSPESMAQIENSVKLLALRAIKINKVDMIKALLINDGTDTETDVDILESIRSIMENKTVDELFESIQNLINEPSLVTQIISEVQKQIDNFMDEITVAETLRKCIVSAVQNLTEDKIKKITQTHDKHSAEKLNTYLTDTLSLARALGFTECILNLSNILNSNGDDIITQLKEDEKTYELLQRVVVMHKLSESDEMRAKAIQSLRTDPYSSRTNLVLRELLRCSGICTINLAEGNKLKDSNDVPISLIYSGNPLAIEDFFMHTQSKASGPILIVKDRFQAVVPREKSRDVMMGKCAYIVLDENGIRHFEPLHMFTALKLKNINMFEDRFSSYSENKTDDKMKNDCDIDIDSILNVGAMAASSSNGFFAYKSTILPKKEIDSLYITQRHPSSHGLFFNRSQVNYRRSFYL